LAARLSGTVLSKDSIRHALFAPHNVEYTTAQDDFVMEVMLQAAAWVFRSHPEHYLFMDGRPFSRTYQIDRVASFASEHKQPCVILECTCSDDTAKARLETQTLSGEHPAANRIFQLYLDIKARFEPITRTKFVIDTDRPFEECIQQALQAIQ